MNHKQHARCKCIELLCYGGNICIVIGNVMHRYVQFAGDYGFSLEVPAKEKLTKSMSWIHSRPNCKDWVDETPLLMRKMRDEDFAEAPCHRPVALPIRSCSPPSYSVMAHFTTPKNKKGLKQHILRMHFKKKREDSYYGYACNP